MYYLPMPCTFQFSSLLLLFFSPEAEAWHVSGSSVKELDIFSPKYRAVIDSERWRTFASFLSTPHTLRRSCSSEQSLKCIMAISHIQDKRSQGQVGGWHFMGKRQVKLVHPAMKWESHTVKAGGIGGPFEASESGWVLLEQICEFSEEWV